MNKIEFINLANKKKWRDLINIDEINPGQTWEYSKFEQLNTKLPAVLLKLTLEKKTLFCPFHFKKMNTYSNIYTLRGFSGFNENLDYLEIKFLKSELEKFKIKKVYFTSNPYLEKEPKLNQFSKFKSNVYLIDLSRKTDEIFKSFSNNLKRNLKKIEQKNEINTSFQNKISYNLIQPLYKANLKRINLKTNKLYSYDGLRFLLKNKNNLIIKSKSKNKIVAVSIFILTKYNAYYLTHFSTKDYNFLSGKHIFDAIKILKLKNIKLLNLGGLVKNRPGVEKFKLQFKPKICNLFEYRW